MQPPPRFYDFGPFRLDAEERQLLRDGRPVALTLKVFDVLLFLVEHNGRVVTKDELLDAVWKDSIVEESNVQVNVSTLRKALGDGQDGNKFIETIPKRGYRFIAEVSEVAKSDHQPAAPAMPQTNGNSASTSWLGAKSKLSLHSEAIPTPSNLELARPLRRRRRVALTFALCSIIALVVAYGLYRVIGSGGFRSGNAAAFGTMRITKFTSDGKGTNAALSPDAKYVAFVESEAGQQTLWLRQIETGTKLQIAPPTEGIYWGLTFANDGGHVYYISKPRGSTIGELYKVSVLGGTAQKLIVNIDTPVTFAPDGQRFAFIRRNPAQKEDMLIVAHADGSNEQPLATRKHPNLYSFGGPSWSPDGRLIATGAQSPAVQSSMIVGVNARDGSETPLSSKTWYDTDRVGWTEDGRSLIVSAVDQKFGPYQLWDLSYPGGEVRRITNDLNNYYGLTLSKHASRLVAVQSDEPSNVWLTNIQHGTSKKISTGRYDGYDGLAFTPQGEVVYVSTTGGQPDIWIMKADGSQTRQLTHDGGISPAVTPDGRRIIFVSSETGAPSIWSIESDGRNLKRLTTGGGEKSPSCSPDGRWLVYTSINFKRLTLWKMPMDGGAPVQLTDQLSVQPTISPDGKLIACAYRAEPAAPWRIVLIPFEGGAPVKTFNIPNAFNQTIRWSPDGRSLLYVDTGSVSNIWSQPLDGSLPQQLTRFTEDEIYNFDLSGDGKQLVTARGVRIRDIVLIDNFK